MPRRQKTIIELTEEEYEEKLEQAAARGAGRVADELRGDMNKLQQTLRIARGIVYKTDLCAWLEVSDETLRRWGITPIESAPGQRNLYWIPDVIRQLRGVDEEGEQTEATEAADLLQNHLETAEEEPPSL